MHISLEIQMKIISLKKNERVVFFRTNPQNWSMQLINEALLGGQDVHTLTWRWRPTAWTPRRAPGRRTEQGKCWVVLAERF
jgi:hypothetical protein